MKREALIGARRSTGLGLVSIQSFLLEALDCSRHACDRAITAARERFGLFDYDVLDGDRDVGRIYLVHAMDRAETWFWGISFRVTKRKSYGYASTLEEAEAAFRTDIRLGREPGEACRINRSSPCWAGRPPPSQGGPAVSMAGLFLGYR
jgi:hypothetical protein